MNFDVLDEKDPAALGTTDETRASFDVLDEGGSSLQSTLAVRKSETEIRKETELHGWEKSWEQFDQMVRNALPFLDSKNFFSQAMFHNPASSVGYALNTYLGKDRELVAQGMALPFAKFALPSEREVFEQLSDSDKNRSIAWESFGAALYALGPAFKLAKGPAKKLAAWNSARKLMKIEPIEDAVASIMDKGGVWKGFDHRTAAVRYARNKLRFAGDEAEAIGQVIAGEDSVVLKALQYEKEKLGKGMSKAWKEFVLPPKPGEFYGKPKLSPEALVEMEYGNLQARHFTNLYRQNMQTIGRGTDQFHAQNIMTEQVGRFYGEEAAANLSLSEMSETEMANILSSMLSPKGQKLVGSVHKLAMGEYRVPWMRPEPEVYGLGEAMLRTKSKLFDPTKAAFHNANKYVVEKMSTFMQMLADRHFGAVVEGKRGMEFVPNKAMWNTKNLDSAYDLLKRIDNMAEAGRKGKVVSKADAEASIMAMMDKAKTETPVVAELVSAVRDYHDVLYKDLLQGYLSKVIRRVGLTAEGETVVSNLEKIWLPKVEEAFKTKSLATGGEKVKLVKDMLADFRNELGAGLKENRKVVSGPGIRGFLERRKSKMRLPTDRRGGSDVRASVAQTLFKDSGKILEKKTQDLMGRLTYGGKAAGSIPEYLDHYMPRIAMKGASFEAAWKKALVGEAGFAKARTRIESQADTLIPTLQEMLEARTRAQAKQMFVYDEVSDAVRYAQTLPESWKKHFDFTISRLMGRPSAWDDALATVLQKDLKGNVDAYRASRIAQNVNGMVYGGILGVRPFFVLRNLTQPMLMTPTELGGGIRDTFSVLTGLAKSATKEHRVYMQKIGAITEFLPDYQRGPILPKAGLVAKVDSIRDAFLYGVRGSDKLNRYWSGGMAVDKWDHAVATVKGGAENVSAFSRKIKLGAQQAWVRNEIEGLLNLGRVEDAKAAYVRTIVGNTQWLYGALDMPSMTGVGGTQKVFTAMNSWWMNYGSALSRWMHTGTGTDKVKRMGTFLVTSLAVEQALEAAAGRDTAMKSVFLGPLPLGEFGTPPALAPVVEMIKALSATADPALVGDESGRSRVLRGIFRSLKSAGRTYVPGGTQIAKGIKGYQKNEWQGVADSIIQYKRDKDFEPLFGLIE